MFENCLKSVKINHNYEKVPNKGYYLSLQFYPLHNLITQYLSTSSTVQRRRVFLLAVGRATTTEVVLHQHGSVHPPSWMCL